ncbi:CBS domain-containing protein [Streptomyces sp. TE4109]
MDVPAASMSDDLPYRDIARLLAREQVGAIPVVDDEDQVVGVVSESDLLAKVAFEASGHRVGRIGRLRERRMHGKAFGETAADLMTSPAITVLSGRYG